MNKKIHKIEETQKSEHKIEDNKLQNLRTQWKPKFKRSPSKSDHTNEENKLESTNYEKPNKKNPQISRETPKSEHTNSTKANKNHKLQAKPYISRKTLEDPNCRDTSEAKVGLLRSEDRRVCELTLQSRRRSGRDGIGRSLRLFHLHVLGHLRKTVRTKSQPNKNQY